MSVRNDSCFAATGFAGYQGEDPTSAQLLQPAQVTETEVEGARLRPTDDQTRKCMSQSPPQLLSGELADDESEVSIESLTDSDSDRYSCGCHRHPETRVRPAILFEPGELSGQGLLELDCTRAWFAKHEPETGTERTAPNRATPQTIAALNVRFGSFVVGGACSLTSTEMSSRPDVTVNCLDILRTCALHFAVRRFRRLAGVLEERDIAAGMKDVFDDVIEQLVQAGDSGLLAGGSLPIPQIEAWVQSPNSDQRRGDEMRQRALGRVDLCLLLSPHSDSRPPSSEFVMIMELKRSVRSAHEVLPQLTCYLAALNDSPSSAMHRPAATLDGFPITGVLPAVLQTGLDATLCVAWRDQRLPAAAASYGELPLHVLVGKTYNLTDRDEAVEFMASLINLLSGTAQLRTRQMLPSHADQGYSMSLDGYGGELVGQALNPCSLPPSFTRRFFADSLTSDSESPDSCYDDDDDDSDNMVADPNVRSSDLDSSSDDNKGKPMKRRPAPARNASMTKRQKRRLRKAESALDLMKRAFTNSRRMATLSAGKPGK
ncbi:hypothetical protein PYCC9005_004723 [Savitreella phatthalungensis]